MRVFRLSGFLGFSTLGFLEFLGFGRYDEMPGVLIFLGR
jgi:hypothetical protein